MKLEFISVKERLPEKYRHSASRNCIVIIGNKIENAFYDFDHAKWYSTDKEKWITGVKFWHYIKIEQI